MLNSLFLLRFFHDFPPKLVFSNLHNLYICCTEATYLLYENHTAYVWHYHNSQHPCHASTATCVVGEPAAELAAAPAAEPAAEPTAEPEPKKGVSAEPAADSADFAAAVSTN